MDPSTKTSDLLLTIQAPESALIANSFSGKRTRQTQMRVQCLSCEWDITIDYQPRTVVLLVNSHFLRVITGKDSSYRCRKS